MTIEHSTIADPDIHEPKGVATANSGQVYVADGAGSGSWQAQAAAPSSVTTIESASDFPTAVAGVITLADDTLYQINTDIDIGSNRIVFGDGSEIKGIDSNYSSITTTTTGSVFTANSVNMRLSNLTIVAASASLIVDYTGGGVFDVCALANISSFVHSADFADINTCTFCTMDTVVVDGVTGSATNGIMLTGPFVSFLGDTLSITNHTGIALDLDSATFDTINVEGSTLGGTGGADISLSGLAAGANINANGIARFTDVNFSASIPLNNIDNDDGAYIFENCNGVEDTQRDANGYVNGNATSTAIAVVNTPVKVDVGTGFLNQTSNQFTIVNDGRITYNGKFDDNFTVTYAVQGTGSSGTNTFNFYIAKNGTVVDASKLGREFASTATGAVSCFCILDLTENDYIEVWVENATGTTNFDVVDLKVSVR